MIDVNKIVQKKKWYKRKLVYVILVVILLVGGVVYAQYKKSNQPPQYDTAKVILGTLKQTVDATGNVESASDLDLKFETSGRLTKIYKQVNDQVKKGEILADLDLSQLNGAVVGAQAQVDQARANLNKQLSGNTPEYIAQLQAALDKAKADLDQVKGNAPGVENSKLVTNAYDSLLANLYSVQNVLSSSLTAADNILGVDNIMAIDSFKDVLSVLDSNALNQAKTSYHIAKNSKVDFDNLVNQIDSNTDHTKIDNIANAGKVALNDAKQLLFYTAGTLDKTAPIGSLTQTSLDLMKTNIQTARTSVATKYTSLVDSIHTIDTARNSFFSYQALVDKAVAALWDGQNPPREVDVASYRAALESANANLIQAEANLNKSRIYAPADGAIGKINPKVGELVTSQDVVIKLVDPHFEVRVDIPETDIIKVKMGDTAEIKLDAYGDDVKFKGIVTQIEKGQTVIQDVVYYRVIVSLEDNNNDHQILNGMTANVIFATEQKDSVLYIPQRAVRTNSGKYVKVLENGKVTDTEITLGLRGDGGMVEVTKGLSEGQVIVLGTVTQ